MGYSPKEIVERHAYEPFMRIALEEAEKSANEGNQGVGSVIVRDGEIIARGRNLENTTHDPTAHAESVAIRNHASSFPGPETQRSWDQYFRDPPSLSGTTLFSTFEPCPMCCGAILATGISTLILGGRPKSGTSRWGDYTLERLVKLTERHNKVEIITGVLSNECFDIRNT
jgi:tRNA(adenine34) deaminase